MRTMPIALLVLSTTACSAQSQIDRAFAGDLGFERLYGSTAFSVYYDPIARHCVAYAIFARDGEGGVGVDTFSCNPDELRQRAKEQGSQ